MYGNLKTESNFSGFTNYETFNMNLMINNNEKKYNDVLNILNDSINYDWFYSNLENYIFDMIEINVKNDNSFISDIIFTALHEIDFDQIAKIFYNDNKKER
jgi:hypothetical protein